MPKMWEPTREHNLWGAGVLRDVQACLEAKEMKHIFWMTLLSLSLAFLCVPLCLLTGCDHARVGGESVDVVASASGRL